MNKIRELIEKMCFDCIEKKPIKEVFNTVSPPAKINRTKYLDSGKFPIVDQGQQYIVGYTNDENSLLKQDKYVIFGEHTREIKYVDFSFAQGADGLKILKSKNIKFYNIKYLYYAFKSLLIPSRGYNRHWSIAKELYISIPLLEIQNEIVRILDNFTRLEAELEAELEARTLQYEYYRNKLLDFSKGFVGVPRIDTMLAETCPDGVRYDELGDIASVTKLAGYEFTKHVTYQDYGKVIAIRGLNIKNGKLVLEKLKFIDQSDFSKLSRSKLYVGDMLFTYVGTIGEVALIDEDNKFYLAPNVARIRLNNDNKHNPKFMMYMFQSKFFIDSQINKYLNESSMKNLTMANIRKFLFPDLPIMIQNEIVKILDNFSEYVTSITEGLPAEIEARRKQYEYYRNKLLTF